MREHTKGKLEYSVLENTQIPATLFIKDGNHPDVDIAVFEKWETGWAKKEMEANAKELCLRWNEYPTLKQQRDDLLNLCKEFKKVWKQEKQSIPQLVINLGKVYKIVEAAIAKCEA